MRAAEAATADGLGAVEREEKRMLRRFSHAPGTPTPSPPGQPPALITGALRRSWRATAPRRTRTWTVYAKGGPTAPQSRVQELGGGPSDLPRRPFHRPAVEASRVAIFDGYRRRYTAVILMVK